MNTTTEAEKNVSASKVPRPGTSRTRQIIADVDLATRPDISVELSLRGQHQLNCQTARKLTAVGRVSSCGERHVHANIPLPAAAVWPDIQQP